MKRWRLGGEEIWEFRTIAQRSLILLDFALHPVDSANFAPLH